MDSSRAFAYDDANTVPPTAHPAYTLPIKEMVGLCQSMRENTPSSLTQNSIICFTGSGDDEAIGTVAFESALVAQTQVNLRVILIDAIAYPKGSRKDLLSNLRMTLQYALKAGSPIHEAITIVHGTALSYACLSQRGHSGTVMSVFGSLKKLLDDLRSSYDLIIINAGSITSGALAPEMIKLSDGAVMVVEAEKTRAPVALRTKNIIEASGGKVIGAVLGNRRHHIPSVLYRWL